MNWRYLDHPYRRHEIVTLRKADSLLACAVIREEAQNLDLVDLFGYEDAIEELVEEVLIIAAGRRLNAVTVELLASHHWTKTFRALGFSAREKFPVVTHCSARENTADDPGWMLMKGDRES